MITKTNFSSITLLGGLDICVYVDSSPYVFHIPTLKETLIPGYKTFEHVCVSQLDLLVSKLQNKEAITTKLDFILLLLNNGMEEVNSILYGLKLTIGDFSYKDKNLFCGSKIITAEAFDVLCDYLSVGCGYSSLKDLEGREAEAERLRNRSPEEVEWERRIAENDARVKKIKSSAGNGTTLDTVLVSVMHEFNKSMDELMNMNLFTIYYLYEQVFKIASYLVSLISAGNGLIDPKKTKHRHKHWSQA